MMRNASFQRNRSLETLLKELNESLAASDATLDVDYVEKFSKIFVVGSFRSGTTLFMQWLASTGLVAYPTNMLSRFFGAPLTGAKIQQILTDPRFNFRNEILDFNSDILYTSENGKTKGALAPNEFWYFWRRFLPYDELDHAPDDKLRNSTNFARLRDELNGLTNIFNKPFALKAMIMNQNLLPLSELFRRAIFIWMKRDPVFTIQSALLARKRQYGNYETWYSFKIKEFSELSVLDPLHSVAGQIAATNIALEKARLTVAPESWIDVPYESFCKSPALYYERISGVLLDQQNETVIPPYSGVPEFENSNIWKITEYSQQEAERAYEAMYAQIKKAGNLE